LPWGLRSALAATAPIVLLYGSVYLKADPSGRFSWQTGTLIGLAVIVLTTTWSLLNWLHQRPAGMSTTVAVSLASAIAGLCIMMAGYIKGGAAAFPLAATLLVTAAGLVCITLRVKLTTEFDATALSAVGVVGLFGLLFIGRFFGGLSTAQALTLLLAPLLCGVTELPWLRERPKWQLVTVRLTLVTTLLAIVLFLAKRTFDRDMGPLLRRKPDVRHVVASQTAEPASLWR
ncbi:MAG: hypothetical protein KDA92_24145, partial [Planctomycetales bacterium]|nr:hypothetical protein [Planctomycetales bacterium]